MSKICWICKNSDDLFIEQRNELLKYVNEQIKECDNYEKTVKESMAEKLGFTKTSKEKIKSIKQVYADMTFNAVSDNRRNFIQLEPALEILLQYSDKYYGKNANFETLRDLIEKYLQEPIEARYVSEQMLNKRKRQNLLLKKEKLEELKTFFVEKNITSEYLDSVLGKQFFSFSNLGFKIKTKIYLCPFCAALFAESDIPKLGMQDLKHRTTRQAQPNICYDEDWGDEEDFL